jgi:hypothetical protein
MFRFISDEDDDESKLREKEIKNIESKIQKIEVQKAICPLCQTSCRL